MRRTCLTFSRARSFSHFAHLPRPVKTFPCATGRGGGTPTQREGRHVADAKSVRRVAQVAGEICHSRGAAKRGRTLRLWLNGRAEAVDSLVRPLAVNRWSHAGWVTSGATRQTSPPVVG